MKRLRLVRSGHMVTQIAGLLLAIFLLIAIFAPLLAPHDPNAQDLMYRLKAPIWLANHADGYLLGTDNLGRDVLSRLIYGSRVSIMVGICAVVLSGVIGTMIGLLSGYYRFLDQIAMRFADIQLAFPTILLALVIVAVVGGGMKNLILVLGITGWVPYARVIRSEVLSIRTSDFVVAAQTIGANDSRILFRHILPNIYAPIITIGTFQIASAIISESSLSFLGLGIPANIPSWGSMLSQGQLYINTAWWITVFPGFSLMLVVLAINLLGDTVRDYMDPKTRKE
ncbi:ABC transporter permease [Paenibacillus filicis]|uniref:ABC transporter permease n=1 Tax=Paenibacillus gyeongsangnamensis TaxID=3388067 RepID=A0ABT4Q431_9BACL|nr:ABC transporter permease [Paenibacillus filicis]MCZ8511450.1 ABC transporter permease [Paenibacillus filicis]